MIETNEILKELQKRLATYDSAGLKSENVGTVIKNNDGVITASGLSKAVMGEIVIFPTGATGVIFNLDEDTVAIIALENVATVKEGDLVKRTEKLMTIDVSEALLGRVVNTLGMPLDGKPKVKGKPLPLERIAAGVVEREPVDTPLKTGIKAIDAIIPIGRGQRELIIGDRGLGKTAIAIDAIINQKRTHLKTKDQRPVFCVYVAIGQKQSTVAQIINRLKETGAFEYTVVVSSTASDPAALQYLAPYAGTAIAEFFMERGDDVLIVYDDLTKHAWAYREVSLVLRRPAGREAYPGDIFYLHSRLLERSVKLNKENGGGSITALPIIETQAGDISAYIPTNVISITDGQIFLVSDLFNIGIRPAIDAGNSVSRVGGAAQTKTMKSVAGKLRLELAQYNSLAAFAQFGSELDPSTLAQLEQGKRITEILKQPQYHPLSEAEEVLVLWAVTNGHLSDVSISQVSKFETELLEYVHTHDKKTLEKLSNGNKVDEETTKELVQILEAFKKTFGDNPKTSETKPSSSEEVKEERKDKKVSKTRR